MDLFDELDKFKGKLLDLKQQDKVKKEIELSKKSLAWLMAPTLGEAEDIKEREMQKYRLEKLRQAYPENPACSNCGGVMLVRVNKSTGDRFLGCSNFPKCKHTHNGLNKKHK